MLFSSITFLYYFLPITLLIYFMAPHKGKNAVLLLASFLFYFWGEPKYCLLMAVSVLTGYFGGRLIDRTREQASLCKFITGISIGVLLLFLGIFKYADFTISTIRGITGTDIPLLKLALPVGISFYTFQIVSYLVDVSRKTVKVEAEKNLIDFAAYVTMFPQLIAGPIVRYETIQTQMKKRELSIKNLADGGSRFVCGLAKKVLFADVIGELVIKLDQIADKGSFLYWMAAIAYTLQIYYDFSGYSDMAIGLGKILGFDFPENFNYPYISKSVTEFWKRWHMTLGTWFKDYVYIPLGGSRVSFLRFGLNVFVVWFLSGLWHGADWTFVLWGLYFGVLLVLEKIFLFHRRHAAVKCKSTPLLKKIRNACISGAAHLYTMALVILGFELFRAENIKAAFRNLKGMFGLEGAGSPYAFQIGVYEVKSYGVVLILAVLGAAPMLKWIRSKLERYEVFSGVGQVLQPVALLFLLLLSTSFLISSSVHPFLYFRF